LRGDIETVASHNNPANFWPFLKVFAENDSVLHAHLHWPRARNVTYLSPKSQNEIIEVIGFDVICTSIINEVKNAMFYSILADEVSSHNVEHMALCLHFVDENCDLQEKFIGFVKLQSIRANDIANAIITTLEDLKLSLMHL